ncbi:MAG: Rpn family recombination-promoting nuclease/putative transposase [Bacteroidia bacterium]|nr:Rpn family recombination-promoting nuclease/putative transposase [Bacteroidia bacterium]
MSKKLIRFDWAMKTLLRDKANFDVLEGFLCALLDDDNIKIINLLESESNQTDETDKFNRVDLLIQDSQNRKIFIEIQNTRETDYLERLLYGTSKIIVEHQKLGDDFSNISKVISISILYFNLGTGDDYIYYGTTDFKGLNTGNPLIVKKRINVSEMLEPKYKFVEKKIFPEYYLITVEQYKNIIQKKIDEWIYMIKNNEIAEGSVSKNIDKAEQKLAELNMTVAERKRYEKYLINTVRDRDAINTAKEEGRDEERIVQEKKQHQEKLEIARNLKKASVQIEIIIQSTGLSKEEIEKLL